MREQGRPQEVKVVEARRLVWFREKADADFWDRHWAGAARTWQLAGVQIDCLGELKVMTQFLPREGMILEAGCGVGYYVAALSAMGYTAEGVEWGAKTVEAVRRLNPKLPIRVGDVTSLDVPDGCYTAYVSLGVMEHRQEGPDPFLKEAHRVLNTDGVALISVPWFHGLRRLKARLGCYHGNPAGLDFYQYAFRSEDFESCLSGAGFAVVERFAYDGFKGVKDEVPLVRRMLEWRTVGWRLRRRLSHSQWVRHNLGHMMLFVCRKK